MQAIRYRLSAAALFRTLSLNLTVKRWVEGLAARSDFLKSKQKGVLWSLLITASRSSILRMPGDEKISLFRRYSIINIG